MGIFSRKERAKRKRAQEEGRSSVQIASAYPKHDYYQTPTAGPRSAYPRPLSSFAPDLSRQSYYQAQYAQQLSRASCDQPPLPTYDPSKYQPQPVRPTSIPNYDLSAFQQHPFVGGGQSSQLSAAHYQNPRASVYQPLPAFGVGPFAPPKLPYESVARNNRRQSAMPFRPTSDEHQTGRERSTSEPMRVNPVEGQDTKGRRPKPVLSRLITNFG